jgi:hypothetical protein
LLAATILLDILQEKTGKPIGRAGQSRIDPISGLPTALNKRLLTVSDVKENVIRTREGRSAQFKKIW